MLYVEKRRQRDRLALAEFAWSSDPWRPAVCLSLAESRLEAGDREGALDVLGVCSGLPMSEAEAARFERVLERAGDPAQNR